MDADTTGNIVMAGITNDNLITGTTDSMVHIAYLAYPSLSLKWAKFLNLCATTCNQFSQRIVMNKDDTSKIALGAMSTTVSPFRMIIMMFRATDGQLLNSYHTSTTTQYNAISALMFSGFNPYRIVAAFSSSIGEAVSFTFTDSQTAWVQSNWYLTGGSAATALVTSPNYDFIFFANSWSGSGGILYSISKFQPYNKFYSLSMSTIYNQKTYISTMSFDPTFTSLFGCESSTYIEGQHASFWYIANSTTSPVPYALSFPDTTMYKCDSMYVDAPNLAFIFTVPRTNHQNLNIFTPAATVFPTIIVFPLNSACSRYTLNYYSRMFASVPIINDNTFQVFWGGIESSFSSVSTVFSGYPIVVNFDNQQTNVTSSSSLYLEGQWNFTIYNITVFINNSAITYGVPLTLYAGEVQSCDLIGQSITNSLANKAFMPYIANQTYTVKGTALTFSTLIVKKCPQHVVASYSATSNGTALPAFIAFDTSTAVFSIYTTDFTKTGIYNIIVSATDSTYGTIDQSFFSLNVTKCPDTATVASVSTSTIDYYWPGTAQSATFNAFTVSESICSFTYSLYESDGVTAFNASRIASFDSTTRTFVINENDPLLINTIYTVVVKGVLNNDAMTTTQTSIQIRISDYDGTISFTTIPSDYTYTVLSTQQQHSYSYTWDRLPAIVFSNITVSMAASPNTVTPSQFITVNSTHVSLYSADNNHQGTFTITVTLTTQFGKSTSFSFVAIIIPFCPTTATITASAISSPVVYDVLSVDESFTFTAFTTSNSSACSISYQLFQSDGLTAIPGTIISSFTSSTQTLIIHISDTSLINTYYTVKVKGTLSNSNLVSTTATFQIMITDHNGTYTITQYTPVLNYVIGASSLESSYVYTWDRLVAPDFNTLTFDLVASPLNETETDFVTINQTHIVIYSSDTAKHGNYTLTITCTTQYGIVTTVSIPLVMRFDCPVGATVASQGSASTAVLYDEFYVDQLVTFSEFLSSSGDCLITYTLFEADGVTPANLSVIPSLDQFGYTFTIHVNDYARVNSIYSVVLVGSLDNAANASDSVIFDIELTDWNGTVTFTTVPTALVYTVNDTALNFQYDWTWNRWLGPDYSTFDVVITAPGVANTADFLTINETDIEIFTDTNQYNGTFVVTISFTTDYGITSTFSFSLTINPICPQNANLTASTLTSPILYDYFGVDKLISFLAFSVDNTACEFTYSIVDQATLGVVDANVVALFTNNTRQVKVNIVDYTYINTYYTMRVYGTVNNSLSSSTFLDIQLMITDHNGTLTFTTVPPQFGYRITDRKKSEAYAYTWDRWVDPVYSSFDILITSSPSDIDVTSIVTINGTHVSVYTRNNSIEGDYTITVSFTTEYGIETTMSFIVTFINKFADRENYAPIFQPSLENLTIYAGDRFNSSFPPVKDPAYYPPVTMDVQFRGAYVFPKFFTYLQAENKYMINPIEDDIGVYYIEIVLTNGLTLTRTVLYRIEVMPRYTEPIKNITKPLIPKPKPTFAPKSLVYQYKPIQWADLRLVRMDEYGVIEVEYKLKDKRHLKQMMQSETNNKKDTTDYFQNQDINNYIELKLAGYDEPLPLSVLSTTDTQIFLETDENSLNKIRESNREVMIRFFVVPGGQAKEVMVDKGQIVDEQREPIQGLAVAYHVFMTMILIATVVSLCLGNKSAVLFWNFYSSQQLIAHLALLDIQLPSPLFMFLGGISPILKYSVIPLDELTKSLAGVTNNDLDGFNKNFENYGYKFSMFIINIGLPLYLFLMYPFILLTMFALKKLKRDQSRIAIWLKEHFHFNFYCRLFTQTYLITLLCAFVNFKRNYDGQSLSPVDTFTSMASMSSHTSDGFSDFLSVIFLLINFSLPILITVVIYVNHPKLDRLKDKLDLLTKSFTQQMEVKDKIKMGYFAFFYFRRLFFVIVLLFMIQYPAYQLWLLNIFSFAAVIYLMKYKPYTNSLINRLELYNELVQLFILDLCFSFTDISPLSAGKQSTGVFIIVVFIFQFAGNVGVQVTLLSRFYKLWTKKYMRERRLRILNNPKRKVVAIQNEVLNSTQAMLLLSKPNDKKKNKGKNDITAFEVVPPKLDTINETQDINEKDLTSRTKKKPEKKAKLSKRKEQKLKEQKKEQELKELKEKNLKTNMTKMKAVAAMVGLQGLVNQIDSEEDNFDTPEAQRQEKNRNQQYQDEETKRDDIDIGFEGEDSEDSEEEQVDDEDMMNNILDEVDPNEDKKKTPGKSQMSVVNTKTQDSLGNEQLTEDAAMLQYEEADSLPVVSPMPQKEPQSSRQASRQQERENKKHKKEKKEKSKRNRQSDNEDDILELKVQEVQIVQEITQEQKKKDKKQSHKNNNHSEISHQEEEDDEFSLFEREEKDKQRKLIEKKEQQERKIREEKEAKENQIKMQQEEEERKQREDKEEQERIEQQKKEKKERDRREKKEREREARKEAERLRVEQERLEEERIQREIEEQERLEEERQEKLERARQEKKERERQERKERERLERQKEKERIERERERERERQEREREKERQMERERLQREQEYERQKELERERAREKELDKQRMRYMQQQDKSRSRNRQGSRQRHQQESEDDEEDERQQYSEKNRQRANSGQRRQAYQEERRNRGSNSRRRQQDSEDDEEEDEYDEEYERQTKNRRSSRYNDRPSPRNSNRRNDRR